MSDENSPMIHNEITVNYANKSLIIPENYKIAGIKGDNNARRLYFRILRQPDDLDLSKGAIEVKYRNALGETGRYLADDVRIEGRDVTFSFLMPATITKERGRVQIQVCGHVDDRHQHLSPANLTIGDFIEITEITKDDPKYDIIVELLNAYNSDERFLTPDKGDERYYLKGENFELTEEQIYALKGEKGDALFTKTSQRNNQNL